MHKFSFYLSNSYSVFAALLKYPLSWAVSPCLCACLLMPSSREIYFSFNAISVLEKKTSTIYMLFTLLTVTALSTGSMSLLLFKSDS